MWKARCRDGCRPAVRATDLARDLDAVRGRLAAGDEAADRLVIDADVIARAPAELNLAGLGDLLATYTAPADWALARLVGQDDSYSQTVVALARAHIDAVHDLAERIPAADPDAIENLSAALTLSGISMGVAGRTAPASGMEHVVSHLIEMSEPPGGHAALHGAKIGPLAALTAMVWARVRARARDGALHSLRFPTPDEMRPRVLGAFAERDRRGAWARSAGAATAASSSAGFPPASSSRDCRTAGSGSTPSSNGLLATPERLIDAVRRSGVLFRVGALGIDEQTLGWALGNCHLMRDRFSSPTSASTGCSAARSAWAD